MLTRTILATGVLALSLSAQAYGIPDNTTTSGGCNVIPFGTVRTSSTWVNQRYQQWVTPVDMARDHCPTLNGNTTGPIGSVQNQNTFAMEVPAQKNTLVVLGVEYFTKTTTSQTAPVTYQTRLHLATGAKPRTGAPARTGTITVGKALGWYRSMFTTPITIAAGTKFFLSYAPQQGKVHYPFVTSGVTGVYYWHGPSTTAWSGPFTTVRWAYRVICASGCPSNNSHLGAPTSPTSRSNANTFAIEIPATVKPRTVTGFSFYTKATTAMNLTIHLHLPTGAKPLLGVARTGTMAIGTATRWYRGTFSTPIVIPANTKFFISYKPDTRMFFPFAPNSAENIIAPYYWHPPNATSWNGPFNTQRWSYRVHCAGSGWISALGFVACGTGNAHHDSIVVKMGYLKGTSMTTNFNNNFDPGAVTVLSANNYDWPRAQNQWRNLHLQRSFFYDPMKGNLLIEILVRGNHNTGTLGWRTGARQRLYKFSWTGATPATGTVAGSAALKVRVSFDVAYAGVYGVGCVGSNRRVPTLAFSGRPRVGGTFTINVANGLPRARFFWVLGLRRPVNPFPLPGGGSCRVYPSIDAVIGGVMSSVGTIRINGAVANNPSLSGLRVFTQFFPFDARANNWGTSATPYGEMLVGLY